MAVTGTADGKRLVHLTARFDSPVFADDAFPGAIEEYLARPHEAQLAGYRCHWVGSIRTDDGKAWDGEIADEYGGRLVLIGKAHGGGVTSLRAVARVEPSVPAATSPSGTGTLVVENPFFVVKSKCDGG